MTQETAAVAEVVLGILSYVRWPIEPTELNLCVVGPTEFADGLVDDLSQANGRPVHTHRKAVDDSLLGTDCNAIYLGVVSDAERQAVFRSLSGRAVLSISEDDPSCSVGSIFCLRIKPHKITFEVNLDSAARSGVRVHPSVLQLAKRQPTHE